MKIFDFNVHLPYITDPNVNKVIAQDLHLDSQGIIKGFNTHYEYFSSVLGANFLLFNTSLFDQSQADFKNLLEKTSGDFKVTALIDVRSERIESYIDSLVANGVRAVMVNSYLQQIDTNDFPKALRAFRYAAQKGLIICIDGSYGTSQMYTHNNMKLACYIADHISNIPIVIVHAGGYRVVEAMLLASDKQNVWLDTSFSLPYYMGSSIEQDFAYVIRKLNFERVVFGSDHPYIPFESALLAHQAFFEKHHFSDVQISKVLYENAIKLFEI